MDELVDAITITKKELKCDADGCDHIEEVAEVTAALIGRECPKCGASLLTEEDYRETMNWIGAMTLINGMVGPGKLSGKGTTLKINPRAGA